MRVCCAVSYPMVIYSSGVGTCMLAISFCMLFINNVDYLPANEYENL